MGKDPIVITNYARTPIGALQGKLSSLSAVALAASTIKHCVATSKIDAEEIESLIMGCVLPAGIGQAPARQAALKSDLPNTINCCTINKMCASGLQAITLAYDQIAAGSYNVMLAGGMESMSNAPYLSLRARAGLRLGHSQLIDHMFHDGLEDAYDKGKLMGVFAEETATKYNFSREMQDEFALQSLQRAKDATDVGYFSNEIVPVEVKLKKEMHTISDDEIPQKVKPEKVAKLNPAFKPDGTVTAANSSSIADGAATVLMMRESKCKKYGIKPVAKIVAYASFSKEPNWFTTAPVGALRALFKKTGWSKDKVDLFEINEAFAVVTMAAINELELDINKVNVYGGACALGHPIGASGSRVVCTLLNSLQQQDKKYGMATLCIGGGEGLAIAIERIS